MDNRVAVHPLQRNRLRGSVLAAAAFGMALYGLIILTNLFTFDFSRPFFGTYGGKLWVANVAVGLLLQTGFAFVMAPTLAAALSSVVQGKLLFLAAFLLPFFLAQLILIWFQIWAPLETGVIAKRLAAKGVGSELLSRGHYVGISDPSKSSLRKMTLVEEDFGMLWLEPHALMYRGDAFDFDVPRDRLLAVERQADAGSTSSYFGAVHVILRVASPDEPTGERRMRLHPEGDWTLTAKARALNELAERLTSWKVSTPESAPLTATSASSGLSV